MIGYIWDPTESMMNLKYFLEDSSMHKERLQKLDIIGSFIQANVKNRVIVNLDSIYGE